MFVNSKALCPAPSPGQATPLLDNPFAPELFASGVSGYSISAGAITATFESARCDHAQTGVVERVVVGRVVLTVPAAQSLVATLNHFLEQQGLSPSTAAVAGATRQ